MSDRKRVLIMGAAGRDFHNFNTYFRGNKKYEVVCFTAEQIPGIDSRTYPAQLAGDLYPKGIPIFPESELVKLIKEHKIEEVILSYSDLPHQEVMDKASTVMAAGADFKLMGTKSTMIKSSKPVISVCAIRTGVGKSQTTRAVVENLKKLGKKVCVIRHPMPYGDLYEQKCQRYEKLSDMDKHKCTIEEREEYENHILAGTILYAGVDYEEIIRSAEKECDVILWDGGNNDWSFYVPDLALTLVDPHRPGHELTYYPGSTNTKMGHVVIMSKSNTAKKEDIATVEKNCKQANPSAKFIQADSTITCEQSDKLKGKKVVVVEDGPTLTHGEMKYGAGIIAAQNSGAVIVDPAKFAVGTIKSTLEKYTHIQKLLPAMGYGDKQIKDLEDSINSIDCDYVICGTPIDLSKVIKINKPVLRVNYDYKDNGELEAILKNFVAKHC